MKKRILLLFLFFILMPTYAGDLTKWVDPFLGVDGEGNVLPGPCLPFGMIRVGPDVEPPQATTGYSSKRKIDGFTQNHVSGTGGGGRYGNFMIIPQTGDVCISGYSSEKSAEKAFAGFYSVKLERWNVLTELTCTERVAMHRYTFPASNNSHILMDLSRVIDRHRGRLDDGKCIDAFAEYISDTKISGYGVFFGGWGHMKPYKVHFVAEFDTPFENYRFWTDDSIVEETNYIRNDKCGFIADFSTVKDQQVQIKISISYNNNENANHFISQLTHWDFEKVHAEAKDAWNNYLNRVRVEGGSNEQLTLLYTGLYRSLVMPTDITGDNPSWHNKKPSFWDYYCIWDTYRTVNPLLTLIAPDKQRDIVISLIDIYEHAGWFPDAWITGEFALKQGGTNADVIIADAMVKGLQGIDYEKAYEGMVKNITIPSDQPRKFGRHPEYLKYGYCPSHVQCGSSYTLEYAYNDFCMAQVAKKLGKLDDYLKYLKMSENSYHLFNPETKYFWAKDTNDIWAPDFSPAHHGDPWWEGPYFYEGTPAHYATYVPHDMQGLIDRHGGNIPFIAFLDNIFDKGYYTHANEPDLLTPFLYNYCGVPYKTTEKVRDILNSEYKVSRDGLPGNDDSGCMSSWYVFAALGFYPVAGQDVYLITSPVFNHSEVDLQNGNTLKITALTLSVDNIYIQSATLNGKSYEKSWFKHEDIINGAELFLQMGPEPSDWGVNNPPPSMTKP